MKDIQVFTALDAKTVAAEKLDILLLSTEGAADMAIYNDLEKLKAAFPGKKVAAMADKMFNQDNTLADTLIRKVRVAGIENPQNVGGTASRIEIAFGENMPTETLEASTAYYAKIGGKTVVEITTSEEVPVDCTGLAKLFAGTSFEEDGVKFTAAVDDNTVTYTSTTRTAVSGYAESISLYKDADCFEDMGLSGAVVSVSVGKADTTKAENLIAAIEDLRDHNDDWYFILTDVTDPVCVTALCKWAESTEPTEAALGAGVEDHRKFYFGQTNDKEYVNEYGRSVVTYADNLAEWADAAWVGSVGPFWPESVTWKWKVPDGVSVADLRDSERDLLEENRVNFMTAEYKHEYMKNGICGDGNFIDNVLGADYITHQIRENLYEIFIANKKIAYTDDGFALVAAGVFAALNRAVELHIIATDPEDDTGVYTVVIPKRADATDEQARNRQMPDIKWSAQLEGAVHSVKVNGTLRVWKAERKKIKNKNTFDFLKEESVMASNIEVASYDPKKVNLVMNGKIITGFASDSMITIARNEDTVTTQVGVKGDVAYNENANESGTITVTLMGTSSSLPYVRSLALKRKEVSVMIVDANDSASVNVAEERCRVIKPPDITRAKEIGSESVSIFVPSLNYR